MSCLLSIFFCGSHVKITPDANTIEEMENPATLKNICITQAQSQALDQLPRQATGQTTIQAQTQTQTHIEPKKQLQVQIATITKDALITISAHGQCPSQEEIKSHRSQLTINQPQETEDVNGCHYVIPLDSPMLKNRSCPTSLSSPRTINLTDFTEQHKNFGKLCLLLQKGQSFGESDIFIVTNRRGYIKAVNDLALTSLGYSSVELLNRPINNIISGPMIKNKTTWLEFDFEMKLTESGRTPGKFPKKLPLGTPEPIEIIVKKDQRQIKQPAEAVRYQIKNTSFLLRIKLL